MNGAYWVAEVRCPHKTGLCYESETMLHNLPCPCNDRSEVLRRFVEVPKDWTPAQVDKFLEES